MASIPDKDERCQRAKRLIAAGMGVCAGCREAGFSEKTYYRWRSERG